MRRDVDCCGEAALERPGRSCWKTRSRSTRETATHENPWRGQAPAVLEGIDARLHGAAQIQAQRRAVIERSPLGAMRVVRNLSSAAVLVACSSSAPPGAQLGPTASTVVIAASAAPPASGGVTAAPRSDVGTAEDSVPFTPTGDEHREHRVAHLGVLGHRARSGRASGICARVPSCRVAAPRSGTTAAPAGGTA